MLSARRLVGTHNIVMLVLDTLRYDVAQAMHEAGETPTLSALLGPQGWQRRHSPANFTLAAHQAFFAGFLPTPVEPGPHPRLFAARFQGSETTDADTFVFDSADIVSGLAGQGYHTLCVGGVGFFNKLNPLGRVLPGLFAESCWESAFGVTDPESTRHQVDWIRRRLQAWEPSRRLFLFVNVAAIHQPNCHHLAGASEDSVASHGAALAYVDAQLGPLFTTLRDLGPALCILCSDHGTAYGEDGYRGHRLSHPVVWDVPYAERLLEPGAR